MTNIDPLDTNMTSELGFENIAYTRFRQFRQFSGRNEEGSDFPGGRVTV